MEEANQRSNLRKWSRRMDEFPTEKTHHTLAQWMKLGLCHKAPCDSFVMHSWDLFLGKNYSPCCKECFWSFLGCLNSRKLTFLRSDFLLRASYIQSTWGYKGPASFPHSENYKGSSQLQTSPAKISLWSHHKSTSLSPLSLSPLSWFPSFLL